MADLTDVCVDSARLWEWSTAGANVLMHAVLEKTEIDGKLGKLQCPGVRGETSLKQGGSTFDLKFESRLHEKAPFGIVTSTWEFERKNNGQVGESGRFKLTLTDTQTSAVSELPDNK